MKEQQKFYYSLILLFLVIVAWGFLFYFPYRGDIDRAEVILSSYQSELSSASEYSKNIAMVQQKKAGLIAALEKDESKILNVSSVDDLLSLLKKEMKIHHINILAISPVMDTYLKIQRNQLVVNYQYLPIEIQVETRFFDFVKFLDNIENLSFYLQPEGISVKSKNEGTNLLLIDLKAKILIKTGANQ